MGELDTVLIPGKKNLPYFVECDNGLAQLLPYYKAQEVLNIGMQTIDVVFKEIETIEELQGYEGLSDFHYRGVVLHGRRTPIIATVTHPFLPPVIGYVELSTTFIMNKPRAVILSGPFQNEDGNISWTKWGLEEMRTKTNLIVRIARCVVYPELRGLAISQRLLFHAFQFAERHWQVKRLRPYFIEITADMLKYLPFAEKAGMHFIGFTEGNLKRVQKDMGYILKNYRRVKDQEILKQESGGIVDLQVGYADKLHTIQNSLKLNRQDLLSLLEFRNGKVSKKQYALLRGIIRQPKPTYLKGVSNLASDFLEQRLRELKIEKPASLPDFRSQALNTSIKIKGLSITLHSKVPDTKRTWAIQEAFGIRPDQLSTTLINNLHLDIKPQSVTLIVGPSGTGKTLLLSGLTNTIRTQGLTRVIVEGEISRPSNFRFDTLHAIRSNKPLIEIFGNGDILRAIYVLNMAGMAEAYLYLKRFNDLSAGQQYRAMIARLIDRGRNVWVADEFCTSLDPITAYIVAENLRKHAELTRATVIVAAPHCGAFVQALKPDLVLYLTSGRTYRIFDGSSFVSHMASRGLLGGSS